jgi:tRNA (guanine10-N2)-methyltransferase
MTYRRLPDGEVSDISKGRSKADERGIAADELNEFRRKVCAWIWPCEVPHS